MLLLAYRIFIQLFTGKRAVTEELADYNVKLIEPTLLHGTDIISEFKVLTGNSVNVATGQLDLYFHARTLEGKRAICSFSRMTKKRTNAYEQNVRFLGNRFGFLPIIGDEFDPEDEVVSPTAENLQVFNEWAMTANRLYPDGIRVDLYDDGESDNLSIRFP